VRAIGFSEDDGRGFAGRQISGGKAAFIAIALRATRSTLRANCAPLPCVAMPLLDKLERRFGFLAIPGLIRIVIGFTALVYLLVYLNRGFESFLALDPALIRRGQVWRLVTYIFLPQTFSPLWLLLALWFLWFIGEGLERAWGSFRLTLYFVVGMIGTTIAAFFFGSNFSNGMLIASLFFAFARFYPDEIIYILFILPVKIKWLAWAFAAFLLFGFAVNSNSYRAALVAAFANYFIFFGPEMIHQARHRHEVSARRQRFEAHSRSADEALHRCAVCGATELTDPTLDFRVARDGEEYCMAHLPRAQASMQ
jgi:membrane associated rhomboid family serine protease